MRWMLKLATFFNLLIIAMNCNANVTLSRVFTDNMVIQRDKPITVWGWAAPGEKVTVTLADKTASAVADKGGKWQVTLPKRGLGPALTMTVKGNNEIKLSNILMGDVWLCSGQSNMEFGVNLLKNPTKEIADAAYPKIRIFYVAKRAERHPQDRLGKAGGWLECTTENLMKNGEWRGFSAVAYFFAKYLQQALPEIPQGMLHASRGGSLIQPWTTEAGWQSVPELAYDYKRMKSINVDKVKRLGNNSLFPGLYNAMINPLTKLQIKGILWYQGESNRYDGERYFYRMQALINGWRAIWGKDVPFYFVQLAPFKYGRDKGKQLLPPIWQAQSRTAREIPNTGMAVTIDIGDFNDIHPKNKDDVGRRLSLLARKYTYGQKLTAESPTPVSAKVKGGKVVIKFKDVAGGLQTADGKTEVAGFELAGADGKFKPAQAVISDDDKVTVSSAEVTEPTAVRFAWTNTPTVNLQSKAGLPVGCFSMSTTTDRH